MAVPCYGIHETTTFWSEQQLVELLRVENPAIILGGLNEPFSIVFSLTPEQGPQWFLKYGKVRVLELLFSGATFNEDWPELEQLFDKDANTHKFKLCVENRSHWYGSEGSAPPVDIQIRPEGYNAAWQLAWQYARAADGQPTIEIARVEGGKVFIIHTLRGSDLGAHVDRTFTPDGEELAPERAGGAEWLSKRKPILMSKHWSYITISMNAHLARKWDVEKGYSRENWSDPVPRFQSYTMSPAETAWISNDNRATAYRLTNTAINTHLVGPPAGTVGSMLASLYECALAE